MGGVTLVLSEDFRQTLPVIPRGTRADELKACLKTSYYGEVSTNMRSQLHVDEQSGQLAKNLLQVGNGTVRLDAEGDIPMVAICTLVQTIDDLQFLVYPNSIFMTRNGCANVQFWPRKMSP